MHNQTNTHFTTRPLMRTSGGSYAIINHHFAPCSKPPLFTVGGLDVAAIINIPPTNRRKKRIHPVVIKTHFLLILIWLMPDIWIFGFSFMHASPNVDEFYISSSSIKVAKKSFGCRNKTGFSCAPKRGAPSPSIRTPCCSNFSLAT